MGPLKYKIGDVARILGISPDLLRYYEKKGVVAPEKNRENSYRYYDAWDINFLTDCLWFKNFGFSIEQVAEIVRIPSAEELSELFLGKEEELRGTIRRCELLLRRSIEHREDLKRSRELLGRCEISRSPENVHFINRVGSEYITAPDAGRSAAKWLQVMPFNRRYFEMDNRAFLPGSSEDYRWGYSLTADYIDALGFEPSPPDEYCPARRSIHTVFKSSGGRSGFAPSLLQYALDYAAERGLIITGPVNGVLLASVMERDELYGYFEAWLPIE